jgi:hypothetical protein
MLKLKYIKILKGEIMSNKNLLDAIENPYLEFDLNDDYKREDNVDEKGFVFYGLNKNSNEVKLFSTDDIKKGYKKAEKMGYNKNKIAVYINYQGTTFF